MKEILPEAKKNNVTRKINTLMSDMYFLMVYRMTQLYTVFQGYVASTYRYDDHT